MDATEDDAWRRLRGLAPERGCRASHLRIVADVAAGHSIDEYLETIYFLAFPIGEYRPETKGCPPSPSAWPTCSASHAPLRARC